MAEESNGRITVSRDALRADLSDLKNELKDYISTQLERKADTSEVRSMSEAVRSLTDWSIRAQRGEFTEAQKNTVERWMDKTYTERAKDSWKGWERKLAVSGVFVGFMGSVGAVVMAIRTFHG